MKEGRDVGHDGLRTEAGSAARHEAKLEVPASPMTSSRMTKRTSDGDEVTVHASRSIYTENTRRAVTLGGRHLLRAVPISTVLHLGGSILQSNVGLEEHYDLSAPVTHLDAFLSHTWSTSRSKKFMTLVVYYNFWPALVMGLVSAMITGVLVSTGVMTQIQMRDAMIIIQPRASGQACELVGFIFFVVGLISWHEIAAFVGCKGSRVFLDKSCIHQTDEAKKRQGIQGLAAFLTKSRSLVVLHTDEYLQRLWTVYELASYLLLNPEGYVELLPVDLPLMLLATLMLVAVDLVTCIKMLPPCILYQKFWEGDRLVADCVLLHGLIATVMGMLFFRWERMLRRMWAQLATFDITVSKCACEGDRPLVEGNVEAFLKHMGVVDADAAHAEAMEAFNTLVREIVPRLISKSLGLLGVRYKVAILISMRFVFHPFDDIAYDIAEGNLWQEWFCDIVRDIALCFARGPILVAIAAYLGKRYACYEGWRAGLALFMTILAIQTAAHIMNIALYTLHDLATVSIEGVIAYLAYCSGLGFIAYAIFRRRDDGGRFYDVGSKDLLCDDESCRSKRADTCFMREAQSPIEEDMAIATTV
mmetsp:Transcript_36063/g.92922  ORF Transcript_36063/g.92922 Transcript_36063/m.92922 type:complete len:588 (+) Transcript_36063:100-1863(+)|eukprot:CAMPEP_0195072774 /NCGR_PEP_ID=MMETSP0448-20130528/16272_1 /TAXON_ID=66468 /ORGANISM="Heterocapsa triquestra, Strain CCMP 448" /LENGTH=587 /DNA_ID=CAMNT_0040104807 /DNA_START=100 /DNA_END=1863 /DNA_ORIENTATION=-